MAVNTKKIKVTISNKLKGAYGSTEFVNGKPKKVVINKKLHKQDIPRVNKNKDGTESLIGTVLHEFFHVRHPKMTEKVVRKKTVKKLKTITNKEKRKIYNKLK